MKYSIRRKSSSVVFAVVACSLASAVSVSHAQVVFTQNFSSSTTVTDYMGSGANQFTGINSGGTDFNWTIGGGALQGARTNVSGGASGSANKVGILSLTSGAASYAFDFNATTGTNNTAGTNDVFFQVGSGYTATSTGAQTAQTYAQFPIDLLNNNQYSVSSTSGTVTLSGAHHFTFDLNNTGGPVTFITPAGAPLVVANDTFALFYDTTTLASGLSVSATGGTASLDITDFKVRYGVDFGTISIDNLTVTAVPEPGTCVGLGLGAMVGLGFALRRQRRARLA